MPDWGLLQDDILLWLRLVRTWNRDMAFGVAEFFGLDIGDAAVKAVLLKKASGGYRLIGAEVCPIEASPSDEDRHRLNTIEAIRRCMASAKIETKSAVCAVSGPEVAVRTFEFPDLTAEEMEGAVTLEAAQVCPFDVQNAAVVHQVVVKTHGKTRGVLAAATNAVIEARRRLVEEAGLRCALLDVEGLALLNALGLVQAGEDSDRPKAQAVLNVGTTHATLAVASPDGIPFVRDVPVPAETPQMQDLNTPLAAKGMAVDPARADGLRPAMEDVAKTIRFYLAQNPALTLEGVRVCGDLTAGRAFMDLVKGTLPVPAAVWNPMEEIDCGSAARGRDLVRDQGPAMAVAIGLAMRTV